MPDNREQAVASSEGAEAPIHEARQPPHPPRAVASFLAFAVLGLIGFSIALAAYSLLIGRQIPEFYYTNALGRARRLRLLLTLGAAVGLPIVAAGLYWWRQRARGLDRIESLARLTCPLLLSCFVPALYVWEFGQRATLQYLFLLVLFVFVSQALIRVSLSEWERVRKPGFVVRASGSVNSFCTRHADVISWTIVLAAAGAYSLYTGYYTVLQHRLIKTSAFDLGIYDNLMAAALRGASFRSPVLFGDMQHNYLAGHAEYGMLLFLPIYAIKPGPETLLLIQSFTLGFAAVPLFLFARTRLPRGLSVLLSVGYLLFAPLHGPNFYDFHWLPLAIPFHFSLYFALATRRTWLAVAMVIVLFSLREDIALGLVVLGAFLCVSGERVRFGLVLSVTSLAWFVVNKFVIMRLAGTWWFDDIYAELFADGKRGYGSVLKTMLSNPTYVVTTLAREPKLVYVLHLLAPLAFLPVRKWGLVALLLPGFFFTLLTTAYWPTTSIAFQYTTHWIPYLFLATIISLWLFAREVDGRIKRRAAVVSLVLVLTSHSYNFGAILQRTSFVGGFASIAFAATPESQQRFDALQGLVKQIPSEASVAATENLTPHVSTRLEAYTFRYDVPVVDYVLVSQGEVSGDTERYLTRLLKKADYGLVGEPAKDLYLFKKGAVSPNTAAALEDLGVGLRGKVRRKRRN